MFDEPVYALGDRRGSLMGRRESIAAPVRAATLLRRAAVVVLSAVGVSLPATGYGDVRIERTETTVRVTTSKDTVADVLAAFCATLDVRYRTSIPLDRVVSGTYSGSVTKIIGRLLDGHDFVIKSDGGLIDVTVYAGRGSGGERLDFELLPVVAPKAAGAAPPKRERGPTLPSQVTIFSEHGGSQSYQAYVPPQQDPPASPLLSNLPISPGKAYPAGTPAPPMDCAPRASRPAPSTAAAPSAPPIAVTEPDSAPVAVEQPEPAPALALSPVSRPQAGAVLSSRRSPKLSPR
jgi:hypothetical protein